jgi:hypothetical protein
MEPIDGDLREAIASVAPGRQDCSGVSVSQDSKFKIDTLRPFHDEEIFIQHPCVLYLSCIHGTSPCVACAGRRPLREITRHKYGQGLFAG